MAIHVAVELTFIGQPDIDLAKPAAEAGAGEERRSVLRCGEYSEIGTGSSDNPGIEVRSFVAEAIPEAQVELWQYASDPAGKL